MFWLGWCLCFAFIVIQIVMRPCNRAKYVCCSDKYKVCQPDVFVKNLWLKRGEARKIEKVSHWGTS